MKHIGILGHSTEGSALCYLTACHEGVRRLGDYMHPDITLAMTAMGESMGAWERMDLPPIRATLADTVDRLQRAGADFFVCPDNTAHIALELAGRPLALPGLHIAEVVSVTARKRGHATVGVLGTKWTMEGPVYRDAFLRQGLHFVMPDAADRGVVQHAIFEELCSGVFTDATRAEFARIISHLKDAGCDAVVLGCTEIPLLISDATSPLPTLDSTRLLATAAVDVALGAAPMPVWRGGPIAG